MASDLNLLKTEKWLDIVEINDNLKNVEYIVMAAPTPGTDPSLPIHFTIFLNTQDILPDEISEQVLNKFIKELKITKVHDMIHGNLPVAFSLNNQENAMPLLILDNSATESGLQTISMFVYDFEGNAKGFKECKTESKTGWTYSYSE